MSQDLTTYVNHLMNDLNTITTTIYESLMDGDFDELNIVLDELQETINNLKESIKDE